MLHALFPGTLLFVIHTHTHTHGDTHLNKKVHIETLARKRKLKKKSYIKHTSYTFLVIFFPIPIYTNTDHHIFYFHPFAAPFVMRLLKIHES